MKQCLSLLSLVGAAAALSASYIEANEALLWKSFKDTYGRTYRATDEAARRAVFKRNMLAAVSTGRRNPGATFGMNSLSDMTPEEFAALNTFRASDDPSPPPIFTDEEVRDSANRSVDWRGTAVTHVKNQGSCGSCWAFSLTGGIEGANVLAGYPLTAVSEQQLVSCDHTDGGCGGGNDGVGMKWLVKKYKGRIVTEEAYPYSSGATKVNGKCEWSKSMPVGATITGPMDLPHDEDQMAVWMMTGGPITVAVDASSWQSYSSGVMTDCISKQRNHGVLAVGVTPDYWIVKNSWGSGWGESGYIRLARGGDLCMMATDPRVANVDKAGAVTPAPVATGFAQKVCKDSECVKSCTVNKYDMHSCNNDGQKSSRVTGCSELTGIVTEHYAGINCTGPSVEHQTMEVNACGPIGDGTYLESICTTP